MEDKKEEEKKESHPKEEDKKEEEKKESPPKEEPKKEEKKGEPKKEEPKKDNNTLTAQEQRNLIDQVLKNELDNIKPAHRKSEIKDSYPFWETQPVLQFNKESEIKFGEIWKDHKVEDLPKEPFALKTSI